MGKRMVTIMEPRRNHTEQRSKKWSPLGIELSRSEEYPFRIVASMQKEIKVQMKAAQVRKWISPERSFSSAVNGKYLLSQCFDAFCRRSPFLSARNMHFFYCLRGCTNVAENAEKSASFRFFCGWKTTY